MEHERERRGHRARRAPPDRELVEKELSAVDEACGRFRPDAELTRAERAGRPVTVTPLLAELVAAALDAARRSNGDVDPTLGMDLARLGYDRIATAGDAPAGGWTVHVQDRPVDRPQTVRVTAGTAMATSSTASRSWRRGGRLLHHVLDPRTGVPSSRVWRSVTVCADRRVVANTHSTAALVRGTDTPPALRRAGVAARLVDNQGHVHVLGGWPEGQS